jgi:hypothetical protein
MWNSRFSTCCGSSWKNSQRLPCLVIREVIALLKYPALVKLISPSLFATKLNNFDKSFLSRFMFYSCSSFFCSSSSSSAAAALAAVSFSVAILSAGVSS